MSSQLQEVCTCFHVALVIHISHASLVKKLHTCIVLALHHVSVLQSHLGRLAHHINEQTGQVRLVRFRAKSSQFNGLKFCRYAQ